MLFSGKMNQNSQVKMILRHMRTDEHMNNVYSYLENVVNIAIKSNINV